MTQLQTANLGLEPRPCWLLFVQKPPLGLAEQLFSCSFWFMFGTVPEEIIELIWEPLLLPLCLGPRGVTWGHQESSNPGPASSSSRSGGDTACPGPARPECPWALQVCGWCHTGLLSGSHRSSNPGFVGQPQAVMGEPEPRGTLPPGSSLPAPGLERRVVFPVLLCILRSWKGLVQF